MNKISKSKRKVIKITKRLFFEEYKSSINKYKNRFAHYMLHIMHYMKNPLGGFRGLID